ncbi:cellulase family glycosylhydrolase [Streptosporangium canum]|uniref:glycoside hydrolase family 5 protein n=1 Tax=Streptosporangium canum TaxID=324952 RepID=UPI003448FDDB
MRARALLAVLATALSALTVVPDPAAAGTPTPLEASWEGPLSTQGRYIVDAAGKRFKLRSGNWHGSSGTWTGSGDDEDPANNYASETSHRVPLGLDRVPLSTLVADFHALGVNSVRLPFSNQMLTDSRPVTDAGVAANPRLRGLTPLQVFDKVVEALTADGLAVILNNHTTTTRWCCGVDGNERWNSGQSTQKWVDDWVFIAQRYRANTRVVGADLRNEVRRDTWDNPNWGSGDNHDWAAAAQLAGDRILTEGNANLLIMIEGINWSGIPLDGVWHDRPTLKPVAALSQTLVRSHKLVYAAHFYGYTGPQHTGADGLGETHDYRYRDLSRADLFAAMRDSATYVAATPDRHFTAPVWISEFGIGKDASDKDKTWFANMVDFLVDNDVDFAYWPMVGFQENDQGNMWGLIRYAADGGLRSVTDTDDWRAAHWRRLIAATGFAGQPAPVRTWSMLRASHVDANQSARMRARSDWDGGARKLSCPDDQRLIGISQKGQGGLCTDAGVANLWGSGDATVVTSENVMTDWAAGFTKYQCPTGSFMSGYSLRGDKVSAVLCAPGRIPLAGAGRTLWDDRSDSRPSSGEGGDYASGYRKAQCASDEYAAGVAFSTKIGRYGTPDALYCRKL